MKNYRVLVTREASESCYVVVAAESETEAEELAVDEAENNGVWSVDDCNSHDAYIPDPGNCAEEVEEV